MKSSQRKSNLSYKNKSYRRELKYLQKWFNDLLIIFQQNTKQYVPNDLLQNIGFVIEVLMYNLLYLTPQTRHQLMDFLGRSDFTRLFPKKIFPSLVTAIDLQMQCQHLNVSQTNTWEKFSENLRISTVKVLGIGLANRYKQVAITEHFLQSIGRIDVSPIEELQTQLNFQTNRAFPRDVPGHANSQAFTLPAMEKKIFKDRCMVAEAQNPKEFKKVFQLKTSEIRLPSEEESWLTPLKNWWNRDSIMMSDLTIRVTMLCGLAEDQSLLSLRRQALLQQFLLQIKEEVKAKISAQKNKWFSRKLGLNNALDLQLKKLITRITKTEKLHLNVQPQQPAKEGGQGDSHGTMTGCSVDSDLDLDLDDEPSAQLMTGNTVTTGSPPRFLPTMLLVQQLLLPDLLPKDDKTIAAVPPQQQKQQAIDNTELKKNQAVALNTPLKESAQPQPTKSDHMSKNSQVNQDHVVQIQLAERQVKRPVLNKSLEPAPKPQPPKERTHNHPKPRVNPTTKPKSHQVKPVASVKAPAAQVSKSPSRAELTALLTMNIYELRRKAEKLKEEQRRNNIQPTILQAEAGSILVF